ncbi:hypothetical protein QWY93_10900 [Echinicola jeungdonensis]|uniref:Beta-xylosidase C-terminal Concanavalin A-like domain-containing protein n=1 Tax=Echinicola jeungdonensis TaxID=709343 RepID=A0ABV5J6A2_9BACT|nr:hypothetical protein [Echinicola jeungdonensis]MDN3669832.1 hypothetical protein [Echinicola jeungdonensis]
MKGVNQIEFSYSTDHQNWKPMPLDGPVKSDHLSWWSWGIKAGLFVKAGSYAENRVGVFENFEIKY